MSALLGWTLLGVVILAGTYVGAMRFFRNAPFDQVAEALCRADYQRARSRADTLMVDARRPTTGRLTATTAVDCGTMRTADRIRQEPAAAASEQRRP